MTRVKWRANLQRCSILHKESVATIEVHVTLAEACVLWQILLCELVSRESRIDDARSDGVLSMLGYIYIYIHVPAAVAFAAFAGLHSLDGTEATAARAQQETAATDP